MRRSTVTLFLFLLFLVEGTWMNWLLPSAWQSQVVVGPHLMLTVIILIGIYAGRYRGALYGFSFGLLHDIVYYGPMIGTYTFGMGVLGYLAGMFSFRSQGTILTSMFVVAAGNFLFEWILYGLYQLFQVTHISIHWIFLHQMLPSVLFNLLFALAVYVPVRRLLDKTRMTSSEMEQ